MNHFSRFAVRGSRSVRIPDPGSRSGSHPPTMQLHDHSIERVEQVFAIGIRSGRVCPGRDAGLGELAHVPVLAVRHVPELDRVRRAEAGRVELGRMEVPLAELTVRSGPIGHSVCVSM